MPKSCRISPDTRKGCAVMSISSRSESLGKAATSCISAYGALDSSRLRLPSITASSIASGSIVAVMLCRSITDAIRRSPDTPSR